MPFISVLLGPEGLEARPFRGREEKGEESQLLTGSLVTSLGLHLSLLVEAEEGKEEASESGRGLLEALMLFANPWLPRSLENTETFPKLKQGFGSHSKTQG